MTHVSEMGRGWHEKRGWAGCLTVPENCIRILSLLLAVSIISFALVSGSPVDPVQQYIMKIGPVSAEQRAAIEAYWGMDKPPAVRYISWLDALVHGDFGISLLYRRRD